MKSKLERFSKTIMNRLANYTNDATKVDIYSPFELSNLQITRLGSVIEKQYGFKPHIRVLIDPNLIGGLEVKIKSDVIDSSLKTKLNKIININEKEGAINERK
ncbi:F0F1 ATP synthase subunit delta [Ureaplasma zalophigenitalium]|uniref:F0F1 ATP synthase subunit delta n=1 Tax=Ureaplasma zalophigenitalium TaxID=907723 RepID=A0ABT3BPR9_9BACT|nr:F0F1 ATP synthase subunit delta [Ureaplasma zalophigenitalium]MCV3754250.1 F0F1 ATP synthase subunit delta [Ureaplasma zalophigenitalium]